LGARSVLWPIEDPNLIPEGKYSIEAEFAKKNIHVEFPEPLCSLETSEHEQITFFVKSFGKPKFEVSIDPKNKVIERIKVIRDTPCGSASKVAAKLVGMSYNDMKAFEEQVMQLHDHECVAYMGPERPIMQNAGKLLVEALKAALK
jgi:hypothetical protein